MEGLLVDAEFNAFYKPPFFKFVCVVPQVSIYLETVVIWRGRALEERFSRTPSNDFSIAEHENWKQCQQLLHHIELLHDPELDSGKLLAAWVQVLTTTFSSVCPILKSGTGQERFF